MQNNLKKVDTSVFSPTMLEHVQTRTLGKDAVNNRAFDRYHYPNLEASGLHEDKKEYRAEHLAKDLGFFFRYLSLKECNRITNTIIWLINEALKNYGNVSLRGLGKWFTANRLKATYFNAATGQRYVKKRWKLHRQIEFQPSRRMKYLTTPRDLRYCGLYDISDKADDAPMPQHTAWPHYFWTFVEEKKHRRLGQMLIQEGVNAEHRDVPYSEEYLRALATGEIYDAEKYI